MEFYCYNGEATMNRFAERGKKAAQKKIAHLLTRKKTSYVRFLRLKYPVMVNKDNGENELNLVLFTYLSGLLEC